MNKAITVDQLNVSYNGQTALRDVSFSIEPGNIVGVIGPNGAGKSTLLKSILGLIPKDTGTIKIMENNIRDTRKKLPMSRSEMTLTGIFPFQCLTRFSLDVIQG